MRWPRPVAASLPAQVRTPAEPPTYLAPRYEHGFRRLQEADRQCGRDRLPQQEPVDGPPMCVLAGGATPLRPRRLVEIRRRVFYGRPAVTTAVVVGARAIAASFCMPLIVVVSLLKLLVVNIRKARKGPRGPRRDVRAV